MLAVACRPCRMCVILLSKLGRENMRLYCNDSNTWYVIMDVDANSNHTYIRHLCLPWHLHRYASSRVTVRETSYINVATS